MLVWIVTLIGSLGLSTGDVESVSGSWKVREPFQIEVDGQVCAVRGAVAHLTQTGDVLSGTYEAHFACWSPYAPQIEWSPRHGQIVGRLDGTDFTAQLFVGDPFPIRLEGSIEGSALEGSFKLGDFAEGAWSAARIGAPRSVS